jgi:hypothetical protein
MRIRLVPTLASCLGLAMGAACLAPGAAGADVVWLCKPGEQPNPCKGSLETTKITSEGEESVVDRSNSRRAMVDCFYVYPTVSEQPTINANKSVDPAQTAIAKWQASRFSSRCRVFAPMYRQVTILGLQAPEEQQGAALELAYSDVLRRGRSTCASTTAGARSSSSATPRARGCSATSYAPRSTPSSACASA